MPSYRCIEANADQIASGISNAPFPSAYPFCAGGWARIRQFTADTYAVLCMAVDGSATQENFSISTDVSDNEIRFILDTGAIADPLDVVFTPLGLTALDWFSWVYVARSTTSRQVWLSCRGNIITLSSTVTTGALPALDVITHGYYPFFGSFNSDVDVGGPHFISDRELTPAARTAFLRGADPGTLGHKFLDIWDPAGHKASFTSRKGRFTFTNTGGDYLAAGPPITLPRDRRALMSVIAAGAVNTVSDLDALFLLASEFPAAIRTRLDTDQMLVNENALPQALRSRLDVDNAILDESVLPQALRTHRATEPLFLREQQYRDRSHVATTENLLALDGYTPEIVRTFHALENVLLLTQQTRTREHKSDVDTLLLRSQDQRLREHVAEVERLFLLDSANTTASAIYLQSATDYLLLLSSRTSDRAFVHVDALFTNATSVQQAARSFFGADQILLNDSSDALRNVTRLVIESVLLADATIKAIDRFAIGSLFLSDSADVAKTGEILRYALDALLVYSAVGVSPQMRQISDSVLFSDARLSELVRTLFDTMSLSDADARTREAVARDSAMVADTSDRLRIAQRASVDLALLGEGLVRIMEHGTVDRAFLSDFGAAGKRVERQISESMILLDKHSRDVGLTVLDALLLAEIAQRIRELIVKDDLFTLSTGAGQWFPEVIEFVTYARLATVSTLGTICGQAEVMGHRLDAVDVLGRDLNHSMWRH